MTQISERSSLRVELNRFIFTVRSGQGVIFNNFVYWNRINERFGRTGLHSISQLASISSIFRSALNQLNISGAIIYWIIDRLIPLLNTKHNLARECTLHRWLAGDMDRSNLLEKR